MTGHLHLQSYVFLIWLSYRILATVVKLLKHLKGYKAVLLRRRWRRRVHWSTKSFEAMHQLKWYLNVSDRYSVPNLVCMAYREWVVVSGGWSDWLRKFMGKPWENPWFSAWTCFIMLHQEIMETMEVWEPNQPTPRLTRFSFSLRCGVGNPCQSSPNKSIEQCRLMKYINYIQYSIQ